MQQTWIRIFACLWGSIISLHCNALSNGMITCSVGVVEGTPRALFPHPPKRWRQQWSSAGAGCFAFLFASPCKPRAHKPAFQPHIELHIFSCRVFKMLMLFLLFMLMLMVFNIEVVIVSFEFGSFCWCCSCYNWHVFQFTPCSVFVKVNQ